MVTVIPGVLSKYKKVACISDIHGNYHLLRRLLQKPEVASAELIIFNGDYISRGLESLVCVRWLMSLKNDPRYVILRGNMDRVADWYTYGKAEAVIDHIADHRHTLFSECMAELKQPAATVENFEYQRKLYGRHFTAEIEFLHNLPNIFETECFLFLHGGLPNPPEQWRTATQHEVMKNDSYIFSGANPTGKWVVAGHIPTWNSPCSRNSNNCYVDNARKSLFIDGGNQVKRFAQLNALIIDRPGTNPAFSTAFVSDYPVFRAKRQAVGELPVPYYKPYWPFRDTALQIVGEAGDFLALRCTDGTVVYSHKSHVCPTASGFTFCSNTVTAALDVAEGEELELLDAPAGNTVFVRNQRGLVGWVPRSVLT